MSNLYVGTIINKIKVEEYDKCREICQSHFILHDSIFIFLYEWSVFLTGSDINEIVLENNILSAFLNTYYYTIVIRCL
jgi:hypothetical protein